MGTALKQTKVQLILFVLADTNLKSKFHHICPNQ